MPTTANKGYSVQGSGSNPGTWGAGASHSLNEGMIEIIDKNLGGTTALSLSSTNVSLTASECQNGMLRMTGVLLSNITISPDTGGGALMTGLYAFENLTSGNFAVQLQTGSGSVVLPQSRRGLLWLSSSGVRIIGIAGASVADPIPVGTAMLFYQAAAPSGWTISGTSFNHAIRLSTTGGATSGSVDYSTLFARTATDPTTLTVDQIPSHDHPVKYNTSGDTSTSGGGARVTNLSSSGASTASGAATATGGGSGHTHPLDMRVKTATVIVATKN